MKTISSFLLIIAAWIIFSSCENNNKVADVTLEDIQQEEKAADTMARIDQTPPVKSPANTKSIQPDWDKKIVKTAQLDAEVKDYHNYYRSIADKVRSVGGYISSEQQAQNEFRIENTLTVKVPVHRFDQAVALLLEAAEKVHQKRITSEDVTTEYVDGRSRLEAKRQVRLRYLDLLKQARNMEEVLTVQKEINAVQEDLETVAGRMEYLGQSAAMSTIHLTFYQVLHPSAPVQEGGFFQEVAAAFTNGFYWLGQLLIGLVSIWPLLLLLGIAYLAFRKRMLPGQS